MTIAHKTLKAIDAAMRADQGAAFRRLLRETMPLCEDAYKSDDGLRSHLGASRIGHDCTREIWYAFRWARQSEAEPRMLRLWNRGHLEEGRVIALLRMIGITIYQHDTDGKQFRLAAHGGHYGGSCDGVLVGIPDLPPGMPALGEFKTMADKYFAELRKKGLRDSNPSYFIQMQQYMRHWALAWGLFIAVNKNNDDLHAELVPFDPGVAQAYLTRAGGIIGSATPPPKISNDQTWYQCKMCDFHAVCHRGHAPQRNCRTCVALTPVDGGWHCRARNEMRDKAAQAAGCDQYQRAF